jgi:hypothetical protein
MVRNVDVRNFNVSNIFVINVNIGNTVVEITGKLIFRESVIML